ncbi:uncharacterized protein BcabD6B2_08630 [Babesia caballi]|uniref:Uncharacterized protein n=1 Tax=Babesia caballi TaxID=5871 RepID=A0AAV4LNV4_BABCB|nr:hypothetical protein, conserved [Babesia caballi]
MSIIELSERPQCIVSESVVVVCGLDCGCGSSDEAAIYWVLRVSGRDNGHNDNDAINYLAKELKKLLKHDGSEVAVKVLETYRLASQSVIKELGDQKSERYFVHTALNNLSQGLKPFDPQSAANISADYVEKVGAWATSVQEDTLETLIEGLAKGLNKFVNSQGTGIVQNPTNSAYQSATPWSSLTTSAKTDCAAILLGIMPVMYIGLTYLYWQCEGKGGWATKNSSQDEDLKQFLAAFGYADKNLNELMKGQQIATQLTSAFSSELQTAYNTAKPQNPTSISPSYPEFLEKLQGEASKSAPSTSSPLTYLYLLSHYYITNFLYEVQSSSPASPSFLGYSGLTAMAGGAYGLNLGELDIKSDKVTQALGTDSGNTGLIGKLTEGLKAFIGYKGKEGFIRLNGIGRANDPLERLRDAVLGFWLGALSQVSSLLSGKNEDNKKKVDKVASKIMGAFGRGSAGVKSVAKSVAGLTVTGHNVEGITDILTALKEGINEIKSNLNGENLGTLGGAVDTYLGKVLTKVKDGAGNASSQVQELTAKLSAVVSQPKKQTKEKPIDLTNGGTGIGTQLASIDGSNGAIKNLGNKLTSLNGKPKAKNIVNSFYFACAYFSDVLKMKYTSSYLSSATWQSVGGNQATCAKIFLSCLPLIFNGLSYLYWKCRDGGAWKNQNLTGGSLSPFMEGNWFRNGNMNENMTGTSVVTNVFDEKFEEFNTAATEQNSFSDFIKNFRSKGEQTWRGVSSSASTSNYLSGLYILFSCYFQCQQMTRVKSAFNAPKTIREMLYFLGALQFSPQYDGFDKYVTEYFKVLQPDLKNKKDDSELKLQVADSGTSATGNTLSAADLKSYLASTFHLAPAFIGLIQEPSTTGEPWLHSLFSNSQLNLSIPSSGAGIFGALSNYAYALQFQLHFLYIQCRNTYTVGCGWQLCTFGQNINSDLQSQIVESHICPTGCTNTSKHTGGDHGQGPCEHDNCGTKGKYSPLQAFLTDRLKGFSRGHPSDPSSHLAYCSGSLCHVPMGFNPNDLRAASNGNTQGDNICLTLRPFCGGFNTPLRQLCEKLGCLTKRTPRTLGDLFGFTWHLNGQLFNSNGSATVDLLLAKFFMTLGLEQSDWSQMSTLDPATFRGKVQQKIATIISSSPTQSTQSTIDKALSLFFGLPFWYNLFMVSPDESLPVVLFKVKNIPHQTSKTSQYSGEHDDLYSL